jgi:hypothetical protein
MTHRFLRPPSGLTALAVGMWLAAVPVVGQAPASGAKPVATAAKAYTPPRTPDGQPDLQGFWTNSTYTPLQRPNSVTKEFYTPDEVAAAEKRAAAREDEQSTPGTPADVHYDGTQFGLSRSQSPFSRNLRTSLIVDPPDGKLPPLAPEGQKRAADYLELRKRMGGRWDSAQNNELDDRCISTPNVGPPMLPYPYNNNYQIVQSPGYVAILTEMMHLARIIPLDARPRPGGNLRLLTGISRGRWEGDTLVVETTNLNRETLFGGVDLDGPIDRPNPFRGVGDNVRVTERFTRVQADIISYKFTVEDVTTWTRPWSAEIPMQATKGPLFEVACHEGNYALYNTLVAARAADRKAADVGLRKDSK